MDKKQMMYDRIVLEDLKTELLKMFSNRDDVVFHQIEIVKDTENNHTGTFRIDIRVEAPGSVAIIIDVFKEAFLTGYIKRHMRNNSDFEVENDE